VASDKKKLLTAEGTEKGRRERGEKLLTAKAVNRKGRKRKAAKGAKDANSTLKMGD
jgi:hypothetical protein